MAMHPSSGIVTLQSGNSVDETVGKLEAVLAARGITLFAVVDHSGEAQKAGLQMPNTKLLVFGHPKTGTPIMLASPTAAIDLPLKILISEDGIGRVWISYNSASYLQTRHGFPQELTNSIALDALAEMAAGAARS